jgi:hypothetical protein
MPKKLKKEVKKAIGFGVITSPAPILEAMPFFQVNPKMVQEWTNNPTPGAIDATYAFLKNRVGISGSPVLALLGPKTDKLIKIRQAQKVLNA